MATIDEVKALIEQKKILDVRTDAEFEEVRIPGVIHFELKLIQAGEKPDGIGDEEDYFVVCRSGGRSAIACGLLSQMGCGYPENVEGGTVAWLNAGYPTESGV